MAKLRCTNILVETFLGSPLLFSLLLQGLYKRCGQPSILRVRPNISHAVQNNASLFFTELIFLLNISYGTARARIHYDFSRGTRNMRFRPLLRFWDTCEKTKLEGNEVENPLLETPRLQIQSSLAKYGVVGSKLVPQHLDFLH